MTSPVDPEGTPQEETLLHSAVIAKWHHELDLLGRHLRSRKEADGQQLIQSVVQMQAVIKEELGQRGDAALLDQPAKPDYVGHKAIHIEGVTEVPYPRSS